MCIQKDTRVRFNWRKYRPKWNNRVLYLLVIKIQTRLEVMLLLRTSTETTTRPISNSKNPKAYFFDILKKNTLTLLYHIQVHYIDLIYFILFTLKHQDDFSNHTKIISLATKQLSPQDTLKNHLKSIALWVLSSVCAWNRVVEKQMCNCRVFNEFVWF